MSGKPVANALKVHRAMRNWTQAELAERTGVTRKTINSIETGRYVPSVYVALKIAEAFDLPVEELFRLDGGPGRTDAGLRPDRRKVPAEAEDGQV